MRGRFCVLLLCWCACVFVVVWLVLVCRYYLLSGGVYVLCGGSLSDALFVYVRCLFVDVGCCYTCGMALEGRRRRQILFSWCVCWSIFIYFLFSGVFVYFVVFCYILGMYSCVICCY